MPLNDIMREKAASGSLNDELAAQMGVQPQQQGAGTQPATSAAPTSLKHVVQLEKTDIQMWTQVGILLMLILIYARL